MSIMRITSGIVLIGGAILGFAWAGTQVKARPFDVPDFETQNLGAAEAPPDLPAPVARYVETVFGEELPVVGSALIVGRADMTLNGITMPGRFKMYHDAGQAYYHYMQIAWFGLPVLTVEERYLDGAATLALPGNRVENEPTIDAAANQGLWAESIWLPSILFTDDRAQWAAVDDHTARFIVPNAPKEEAFTVTFDPETGLITELTTLRYRDPEDSERTLWTNRMREWEEVNGVLVPVLAETQWGDDDPWAVWHVETVIYNLDVSHRLAQFGGDFED